MGRVIDRLSDAIEEQIRPFIGAVDVLVTMTGIQRRGAECVIGEIGVDMSRFATARHLASWAGRCPGNDQSAGKRRSGKTRNGSKWLDYALEEAAMAEPCASFKYCTVFCSCCLLKKVTPS